jgi:hypothetical protein
MGAGISAASIRTAKLKRKIRKAKHFGFFFLVYNVFLADSDVSC